MRKIIQYLRLFTLSFVSIMVLLVVSSCETSRVGPEIPRPNPPAPPAQPLIVNGFVKDASNFTPIAGATVRLTKADGTMLTIVLTNNAGLYSYDASTLTDNMIFASGNKDGYGYSSRGVDLYKSLNIAVVDDILLTKLQSIAAPVTVSAGGQASAANNQSVANQPLTVQVPPNAVQNNITLQVASIPASQVPRPIISANATIQSAGQFLPAGTQFSQPITIRFPLPSAQPVGKTFQLLQLNPANNTYTNSGFTGTVDATGTRVEAQVTHFTVYALTDDVTLDVPAVGTESQIEQQTVALKSGTTRRTYTITNSVTVSGTGTVNENWLLDMIYGKLLINPGSSSKTIEYNFPQLPANFIVNGIQYNPNAPNESGDWEYRWVMNKLSISRSGTAAGTGWTRTVNIVEQEWRPNTQLTGWYWISHNQGSVSGPF